MTTGQEDEELKRIRSIFFPAIGIQIITGFNLYPAKENSQDEGNIRISYLHEDLLEDRLHYMQIKHMLEEYCDQIKIERIKHEVINRFSSYHLEEKWRTDKYFLIDQTPVEEKDVDALIKQDITVIGCGSQNELIIKCEKKDMEYILEQFRLYSNKYEIDADTGEFVLIQGTNKRKPNSNETWDEAWDIPCIIVYADGVDRIKTYDGARKISFNIHNNILSLIIGDKWDTVYENESGTLLIPSFEEYLASRDFKPNDINSDYFVNKVFFNWLNHTDWKRVEKTIELYGDMFEMYFNKK